MGIDARGLVPLLQVHDMTVSLRFYRDVLGFEVVAASPERDTPEGRFSHWMWLRLNQAELMLNTAYDEGERPPARDLARADGHRDVGLFIGVPNVDAAHAYLREQGIDASEPRTQSYGMRQCYLSDPDGFGICLQAPG